MSPSIAGDTGFEPHFHKSSHTGDLTRRATAQTIHIRRTVLLRSHLPYIINRHEHLSCYMHLFNGCTRSSFPRDPVKFSGHINVIQAEIKLYSLVVSSIIPRLRKITSQVSRHKTLSIVHFIKSRQQNHLP